MSTVSSPDSFEWHEWLCHSNYSFLAGASHPEELINRADRLGYKSLAITDFDGVYGIIKAHLAIRKRKKNGEHKGLRLIVGCEIHLEQDHDQPILSQNTLVLLAKTKRGYHNLCHIISQTRKHGEKHNARISLDDLLALPTEDLASISPMRGLIRDEQLHSAWTARLQKLNECFKGSNYAAITRLLSPAEDYPITAAVQLARSTSTPILLSQDCFWHERGRKAMSDVLTSIRNNRPLSNVGSQLFPNTERCLHSAKELSGIYKGFSFYEEAMNNSRELSTQFNFDLDCLKYHYPSHMIPEGMTATAYLAQLTWKSAYKRYGDPLPRKMQTLISRELELVSGLGFEDYFLTVWDIVNWARSQNILCQGRGSAANSAVCFVLGITAVDPNRFDLLFERFISAERGDPPDIDVDFEHERREEVIQYIYRRFGRSQAAMVANVITFRIKGALRSVGKALGISEATLSEVSTQLGHRAFDNDPIAEASALIGADPTHAAPPGITAALWCQLAKELVNFPRHLGIHSGGFIIADHDLDQLVPQEPATMAGRTVIQWAKDDIEAMGFFKIDILALGMLTAVRKCLNLVKDHYHQDINIEDLPHDDPSTYRMIQAADTVGAFQIESRAQMAMLPRLRPRCFYDLVVEVGIVRPGPIQGGFIHPYLKRRRGEEPIEYPHPSLRPILERTLGIPIFQEQVMRMAMAIGDFSPGEADELRRQMGAWQIKGDLTPTIKKLADSMRSKGISESYIGQVIQQFKGFAEYGFPESHAASFALIAYASSYLKCHFPAAFTTALLNSQPMGFYSPHALLQDAKRHQIDVRPICVQHSDWTSKLELNGKGEWAIRLGMHLVRGLSKSGGEWIAEHRPTNEGWASLESFIKEQSLTRTDLTALAAADAFCSFGINRRDAIWLMEAAQFAPLIESSEELFANFSPLPPMVALEKDFEHQSTSLGPHPARLMQQSYWAYPIEQSKICTSAKLARGTPNRMVYAFGMVLIRQAPPSAKGMAFLTLEDEEGFINLAVPPQIMKRFKHAINGHGFICAYGRLQKFNDAHSVLVQKIISPVLEDATVEYIERYRNLRTTPVKDSHFEPTQSDHSKEYSVYERFHQSRNYH